jgi:hypothetical protein
MLLGFLSILVDWNINFIHMLSSNRITTSLSVTVLSPYRVKELLQSP